MSDPAASGNPTVDRLDRPAASFPEQEPERDCILDAVVEEFTDRMHAGEHPSIDSYVARNPELGEQLKRLLPWAKAMAQVEFRPAWNGAPQDDPHLPSHRAELGDFRLIREIGRGGMGIVYEAEQKSLGRRVALKILPYAATFDARQLERFKNEARVVAALDHPHIVAIHTIGFEQEVHFYAMQLIEGKSLADVIALWRSAPLELTTAADADHRSGAESGATASAGGPGRELEAIDTAPPASTMAEPVTEDAASAPTVLVTHGAEMSFHQIARWGIQAARALEHAHQMGVVHRDVKPSNLLVNGRGDLWVADFGLAMTGGDGGLTLTGDIPGTLRYMSPEQLRGDRQQLNHRTDIYSLGVTLYELLTLQPAFPTSDRAELTKQIVEIGVSSPRRLNRAIPHDLECIILKAADRDPAQRYRSAGELAEDLRRFLNDEPVLGRLANRFRSSARWSRQHPLRALAALVVIVAVSASLIFAGARRMRERAPSVDPESAATDNRAGMMPSGANSGSPDDSQATGLAQSIYDDWQAGANRFAAGDFDNAVTSLTKAVESYRGLQAAGPIPARQRIVGALAEATLGRILAIQGMHEQSALHLAVGRAEISRLDTPRLVHDRDRRHAASLCLVMAELCAELLLWDEASAYYRQGLAIAPDSMTVPGQWVYAACVTAASGNAEAYRQLTQDAYARYADDHDPAVRWYLTQSLCFGANPSVDRERIVQFAENPWMPLATMDEANRSVWKTVATWANLGAGHFDRAEELAAEGWKDPLMYPVLARIEAHRGQASFANDWLERMELHRRDKARQILFSPPSAANLFDWMLLADLESFGAQARTELRSEPGTQNPWICLVQARNRARFLAGDRAENDFREATEIAPGNVDVLCERGRIYLELGSNDLAARDFQLARQIQPQNPKPLIAEAHAALERGDAELADQRFQETLSLPPDELNLFLETDGWWLAGPYPGNLEAPSPPEGSQELGRQNGTTAAPGEAAIPEVVWRRMRSGDIGKIDLVGRLPSEPGCSAYLLTYVYAPSARKIDFHCGSDGPRRVWLNGRLVHSSNEPCVWEFVADRVPLELNKGRNTVLVKLAGASPERPPLHLFARLDDSPFDRARSLVNVRLYPEASDEFARAFRSVGRRDQSTWQLAAYAAAAAGHVDRYAHWRDAIWNRDRHLSGDGRYWTARTWLLRPAIPWDAGDWRTLLVRREMGPGFFCPPNNVRTHAALAQFRFGEFAEALVEIRELASDDDPQSWPILAMIHHALGNAHEATGALEHAARWRLEFCKQLVENPHDDLCVSWSPQAEFEALFAEACGLLRQHDRAAEPWWRLATARERMRFGYTRAGESDLQEAVDLAGGDPRIWAARGALLAELQQFERASADFRSAQTQCRLAADWHDLARRLARAATSAESSQRRSERDAFRQQAIESMRQAQAAGKTIADQLRDSPDLNSLRDLPGFPKPGD